MSLRAYVFSVILEKADCSLQLAFSPANIKYFVSICVKCTCWILSFFAQCVQTQQPLRAHTAISGSLVCVLMHSHMRTQQSNWPIFNSILFA